MSGRELILLTEGNFELLGRIPRSSNETFLVQVSCGEDEGYAVYKKEAGERPLSDFELGLYRRERAAYLLSESLGWGFVPPTVIRDDAPLGAGSLQWFIECDFQEHYFTLFEDAPETHRELARIALFDYVANNTDRKSGHVLRGDDGRIWGIDHGLCFSAAFKLRTVIWDFAGRPIPEALLEDIAPLAETVPPDVAELLDEDAPPSSAESSGCWLPGHCRWTGRACVIRGRWFEQLLALVITALGCGPLAGPTSCCRTRS